MSGMQGQEHLIRHFIISHGRKAAAVVEALSQTQGVEVPMGTMQASLGTPALTVLSPAAAHPCLISASLPVHQSMHPQESIWVLIAGNEVLRANDRGSFNSGTAPCIWPSLVSSPGLCLDP